MQRGRRERIAEGKIHEIQPRKTRLRLGDRRALPQKPRDQLEGGDVLRNRLLRAIDGIARKIQPRHRQALLIDRIIIQRVALRHICHADHGVMPL